MALICDGSFSIGDNHTACQLFPRHSQPFSINESACQPCNSGKFNRTLSEHTAGVVNAANGKLTNFKPGREQLEMLFEREGEPAELQNRR
jgi:hypothetical protein